MNGKNLKKIKSMKDLNLGKNIIINELIELLTSINMKRSKSISYFKIKNIEKENSDKDNSLSENVEKKNTTNEPEEIVFAPIESDWSEICRKIFNLNPKNFFEKYQTNAYPETTYSKYYEWDGHYSEINFPEWQKIENEENPEIEKFQRIETFCVSLLGIPFVNKSTVVKTSTYWVDKKGVYYMKTSTKNSGVPMSDYFLVETMSEFHPYMNNKKTVFRTYVRINLVKSTFFGGILSSQAKKSYDYEVKRWLEFIEEKGDKIEGDYVYEPKN